MFRNSPLTLKRRRSLAQTPLEKLGLNPNEAKIYLALLDLGEAQAGQLSKKVLINRTTIYDTIERLLEKGLVTYVIQANKKMFRPVPPEKILEKIKEQENIAKEILPDLQARFCAVKEQEESEIYKGRKGIKAILQDILKCKEYVAFGSRGNFLEVMEHDYIVFQRRKKELKIKARVILSDSSRGSDTVRKAESNFRFIPNSYSTLSSTFVYGNQIAIIVWSVVPIATVITSKEVAKSYKNYFELLWKQAKK